VNVTASSAGDAAEAQRHVVDVERRYPSIATAPAGPVRLRLVAFGVGLRLRLGVPPR
jgi:hypothetical protein